MSQTVAGLPDTLAPRHARIHAAVRGRAPLFAALRRVVRAPLARIAPELSELTPLEFAASLTLDAAAWWLLFGSLAVAASRVIFGLRKQVGSIRVLGQYPIEAEIGAGGMGIVYRAQHALLRRPTAVKLLAPARAGEATLRRFEREVKLTARLKHPNTVNVYDYGHTPDGMFDYAMELLDGATLEQIVLSTGPLPIGRVVSVLRQVAGARGEAHELGPIHRDIKPANIMPCNQGGQMDVAKVLDFGLVKELSSSSPQLTQANTITGTPLYMAPEALTSADLVDFRSDLYALGAVAYYLLVGDHVFSGELLVEVCSKHLLHTPEPPSARAGRPVPAALERLVLDCLEKKPEQRPQTARDFSERLERIQAEPWDAAHAEAWWRQHAPSLRGPSGTPSGYMRAIQVDLGVRRTRLARLACRSAPNQRWVAATSSTGVGAGSGGPGIAFVTTTSGASGVDGAPSERPAPRLLI